MHRCIPLVIWLTLPATVLAQGTTEESAFAVDVSFERQHQKFPDSSADLDTISIQPHAYINNWHFSIYLPWQHASGEYFVNGFQPQATYLCQGYGSLTDAQIQFLQWRGRNTEQIEEFCSSEEIGATQVKDDSSGLSDIAASAHYGIGIDDAGLWLLSLGAAYKWDNGDVETGLGSGTRETSVEATIGAEADRWRGSLLTGYAYVSATDADLDNYGFVSIDLAWKFYRWLAVGAAYDFEQSYVPELDAIKSATLYLELKPVSWALVTVAARDYLDTDGFPTEEYSASATFMF